MSDGKEPLLPDDDPDTEETEIIEFGDAEPDDAVDASDKEE